MIEPINNETIDELLPLIGKYQDFYQVNNSDDKRNRAFFSQFDINSEKGCLFGYRLDGKLVAFATVYFCYASTIANKVAIMNDLYTLKEHRRQGIARKLIEHCAQYAIAKGAVRLQWVTAPSNTVARSLYHSMGAEQSSWELFTYSP